MPKPRTGQVAQTGGYFNLAFGVAGNAGNKAFAEAYANTRTYLNPWDYEEMAVHPTIAAGLSFIKSPILSTNWYIEGIGGGDQKIVDEITAQVNRLCPALLEDALTAFDYGFAAFQKIFAVENGKIVIKQMNCLKPHYLKILTDDVGNFKGVRSYFNKTIDIETVPLEGRFREYPYTSSAVFTYNLKFGNKYGLSRLRAARFPYNVQKFVYEMAAMFFESYADPRYVAKVPQGKTIDPSTNKTRDNMAYVAEKLNALNNGGAKNIVLPASRPDDPQYTIELLESKRTGADYTEFIEFLDAQMLRAILIPQETIIPNERGSQGKMKELNQQFAFQYDSELNNLSKFINDEIINPYLFYNYGQSKVGKFNWVYMPMTKKDQNLLRDGVLEAIKVSAVEPDWEWWGRQIGIPLKKGEGLAAIAAKIDATKGTAGAVMEKKACKHTAIKLEAKSDRVGTRFEKQVDFAKIKSMFERAPGDFNNMAGMVDKIKAAFLTQLKAIVEVDDHAALAKLKIEYDNKYRNLFVKQSMDTFDDAVMGVRNELALGIKAVDARTQAIEKSKMQNIADIHLNDMETGVKKVALAGMATEQTFAVISSGVEKFLDGYKDSIKISVEMALQEVIDDGRRYGADDAEVELAQWSAVLDGAQCDLCEELDGMVCEIDSAEYNEFTPGQVHPHCYCVWVYIKRSEEDKPPVDWVNPPQELIDKYTFKLGEE